MTHYKQLGIPEGLYEEIKRVQEEIFHFKNETAVINTLIALGIKSLEEDKREITIDNYTYPATFRIGESGADWTTDNKIGTFTWDKTQEDKYYWNKTDEDTNGTTET